MVLMLPQVRLGRDIEVAKLHCLAGRIIFIVARKLVADVEAGMQVRLALFVSLMFWDHELQYLWTQPQ